MKKYTTVFASFVIMLCLGSVYAWSLVAGELMNTYQFSSSGSQIVFGMIIAIFPLTMLLASRLWQKIRARTIGYISGILFLAGYLLASRSGGNFFLILLGCGVLAGIGTGFGYWVAITIPVQWFPAKKGLITGIATAGFGLGAVVMSDLSEKMLAGGKDVLQLFAFTGIAYGVIILILSNLIAENTKVIDKKTVRLSVNFRHKAFRRLFAGIFLGTFAGLLTIGNLSSIGGQGNLSAHTLAIGVSAFALANFAGRLCWGLIVDYTGTSLSIFAALLIQATAIFFLFAIPLTDFSFLALATLTGFGFGGNFVLFARETAQEFGLENLGTVYPYIFLGYAIAGLAGPLTGGLLYDLSGNYTLALLLSAFISLSGSTLFLFHFIRNRKHAHNL